MLKTAMPMADTFRVQVEDELTGDVRTYYVDADSWDLKGQTDRQAVDSIIGDAVASADIVLSIDDPLGRTIYSQ